jgi:hypothetical protein
MAGYIQLNKASILKKAGTTISRRIRGQVHIGHAEISFFRHFPNVSLRLSGISVRDSGWQAHGHDLLQAETIFIRFAFFSLFSGHPRANKVYLQQGSIYLFTDSTGYSNAYLLKDSQPAGPEKNKEAPSQLPDISLTDMRFVLDKQDKHKLFDLAVRQLDCELKDSGRSLLASVGADMQIHSFCFNTEKGSFIKEKNLSGRFDIRFNIASHIIQFNDITLRIDKHPFHFSGRFFPDVSPDPFFLTIQTSGILFRQDASLMTPALAQKLH